MRTRGRVRRVGKWVGLVTCGLTLAVYAATLWCYIAWNDRHLRRTRPRVRIALVDGSVRLTSGVSIDYTPLGSHARWLWTGPTAGQFGGMSAGWPGGAVTIMSSYAIWPGLCAVAVSTAVLWLFRPRRKLPNHCEQCGYNLTGNVSGVCPECGEKV